MIRKPANYKPLLTIGKDSKTVKGQKYGYLTGVMYLAPSDESGVTNVCPKATTGCRSACLFTAGRGRYDNVWDARVAKTLYMVNDRESFINSLRYDIGRLVRKATKEKLVPCVRINGTSDLPKLARTMAQEFPNVQFYDYTKIPKPWKRSLPNYHLTFSHSETNMADTVDVLAHGGNVAVVFDTHKGEPLPELWHGYKVIDGDLSDLRFTDAKNIVVGVRAKGLAKKDNSGFVQIGA